jgi:antibiotic biosynthesis monooxygenase (ABM) superfamily enzyme
LEESIYKGDVCPDVEKLLAIKRIWRGWTTPENAAGYRRVLEEQVRPGIEAKGIPGFQSLELLFRDLGPEVEFITIMTFDSIDDVVGLQGDDYERAYVPDAAKAVLSRWDSVCLHYETSD